MICNSGEVDFCVDMNYNVCDLGLCVDKNTSKILTPAVSEVGMIDEVKGHPPNRPVYTRLITMCGRGGKFMEAANYLVEMTEMRLILIFGCFDMVTDGLKSCEMHGLAKKIEQFGLAVQDDAFQ
ncbi:hypothetical protein Ddye_007121 [Dipteronia dyeriana]|uniref:Pentatricopeptide repeat-containing protein n=1 Tax=Dipteronia dyeriana TaxID=168575 RepID=A0AAD9XJR2_9ROSI|nr:hypothetical protein Ddye_007121 [Dipteronia dyeriana]